MLKMMLLLRRSTVVSRPAKDAELIRLAATSNIAQFVSFGPGPLPQQRHSCVRGYEIDAPFHDVFDAATALLLTSPSVNVRTFSLSNVKSGPFLYALENVEAIVNAVNGFAREGRFVIVNETIDVNDGGVSGVVLGDVMEFAPGDTPRAVEGAGHVSLERERGVRLLSRVYGFNVVLDYEPRMRIEFSVHPLRSGFRGEHIIVWEAEDVGETALKPALRWPNRFSEHIGDKAFGLLIGNLVCCARVPRTIVFGRSVAPFVFGQRTGTGETWLRTSPRQPVPGRFTTARGWTDPFALLSKEDGDDGMIASVLSQDGVDAKHSGAAYVSVDGDLVVEGTHGYGLEFMQGTAPAESLPDDVLHDVRLLAEQCDAELGSVRFEWVHDGEHAWLVQLHLTSAAMLPGVIHPGEAARWEWFDSTSGLERLRDLIASIAGTDAGVVVTGGAGVTSHVGDLLRAACIPARVGHSASSEATDSPE